MRKSELKELVKNYFSLTEKTEQIDDSITNTEKQTFAEAELVDDTKITNNKEGEFEVGDELFVVTDEGNVVAPSGQHDTKSGISITVDADGKISGIARPDEGGEGSLAEDSIEEAMEATPVAETMSAEEETTEELKEEQLADHGDEEEAMNISEIIDTVMGVVGPEIEAMKAKLAEHEEKMEAFSKAPATQSINENKFNKESKELSFLDARFDFKKAQLDAILNKTNKN